MKMKGLCAHLCCVVISLFLLATCHHSSPDLTAERLGKKTKGSLAYLFRYHYTWNTDLEVLDDFVRLEHLPVRDACVSLNRGNRAVVAEFPIRPQDSVDSVWVKLVHSQDVQGWVRNRDLVRSFIPIDSISQFIHLSSNIHVSYLVIVFALFVGVYLSRAFMRKQSQMVHSNDTDSVYPPFLCLLMVSNATVYEMMQVFVPDTWEYFYFNPTLSPFKVPFILLVFPLSIWLFIVVTLAVLDDLSHQLISVATVFYLLGLMSCHIFCYLFFILTAHTYIGYLFLAYFTWSFVKKVCRNFGYKYRCGNCGQKLREKGACSYCGAINEQDLLTTEDTEGTES